MLDASFISGTGLVPALLVEGPGVKVKKQQWAEYIAYCPSAGESGGKAFTFSCCGIFKESDIGKSVHRGMSG